MGALCLYVLTQQVGFIKLWMIWILACGSYATHENGSGKASVFKALDPAFQTTDGTLWHIRLILSCGGQEVHIPESIVCRE